MLNLAREWSRSGVEVDLLLVQASGAYLEQVPAGLRVVELGSSRTLTSIPALARYLRKARPTALLSGLVHVNVAAILARSLARTGTRLIISERNTPSADKNDVMPATRLGYRLAPYLYPKADGIIAVSAGVANDLAAFAGLPRESIEVVNNPVVTTELRELAKEPFEHRWFRPGLPPVVLAVGRISVQKDYETLVRAFRLLRNERDCRLLILGDGPERAELEALIGELNLREDVELFGFSRNPYAVMARASVLALSSRWEGSPNVLVEAMACGLPVVSTDCPSGPREILMDGKFGGLVPVGDYTQLANAIAKTLDHPTPSTLLKRRSDDYDAKTSAAHYLRVLTGL